MRINNIKAYSEKMDITLAELLGDKVVASDIFRFLRENHKSRCLPLLCDGDNLLCKTEFFSGRCEHEFYMLLIPEYNNEETVEV